MKFVSRRREACLEVREVTSSHDSLTKRLLVFYAGQTEKSDVLPEVTESPDRHAYDKAEVSQNPPLPETAAM